VTDYLGIVLDTVRHVDPILRLLIVFVGMFCETSILIGLLVPGDTIVLVSATAVGSWGEWAALLVVVIVGALCGESVGFVLGRWFGPRIRASRVGRRLGEKNWVRARTYLDRRGGFAVFVSRFLPVLHALIPLTVGMSAMSYRKFIAWTAPACAVWAGAYVSVGWLAAGSYRRLAGQLHFAGLIFAGIIVVFVLLALLIRRAIERSEARHMEPAGPTVPQTEKAPEP
jgi:membrane protein DedA with SNARE-associated domain